MEFKGTKGKWELTERKRSIEVKIKPAVYKSICTSSGNTKWQFDMLLISKAPEMLNMLENINEYLLADGSLKAHSYQEEVEKLIKQATEL